MKRLTPLSLLLPALLACEGAQTTPAPAKADLEPVATTVATTKPAEVLPPPAGKPKSTVSDIPAPKDVAEAPKDAKKEKSGLKSRVIKKGSGKDKPGEDDKVKVHYTGWTKDGKMFDSSVKRGTPSKFRVGGVIKGWREGLQLMVVGEKRRFWIPAKLAYGTKGGFGPKGQLTFDVELLEVIAAPKAPETPKDLKKPGKGTKKTASGLQYRVLTKGKGKRKPKATDKVRVNYSGWSMDGKMFDSSVTRGQPATFPLNGVIKGWTEGLQLMVEGDEFRFWIPADLAYGKKAKRPGTPSGDLVFDVKLLNIL